MSGIEGFLIPFLNPEMILYIAVGVFVGIYVGAIPGLSVTMAVSVLISFTFGWKILPALAVMVGIYVGGVYGGSRSSILLNIPGAPAAIATTFDGFPMAQKGEAGIAMGLSTIQSVIGTLFGILVLALASPLVSNLALKFMPQDYLLISIMGLLLIGSLSKGSIIKALTTACLGILVGMIGIDPITGQARFTFGYDKLLGGINFVAAMIGVFGLSEALMQLRDKVEPVKQKVDKIIPSWNLILKHLPLTLRASILGTIIGALPGTGGDIASLIAYDQAKRTVKNPTRPFGEGAHEGVIAPEAAKNAAIGGAFIPMMTLGIPGDSVTAVLISAMIIHGLRPGPMLMKDQPQFFWVILGCLVISNLFLIIFGMTGIKLFTKIVEIPKAIVIPIIIVLSIVGSYSINNSVVDIYWMIAFGILGYFFKIYNYPTAPMVLGMILSPIIDINYRRAMALNHNNFYELINSLLGSPISFTLIFLIMLMPLSKLKFWKRIKMF
ncbi:tripartite tricarboxylate transporter permease [Caloramator sp. E03]|uniref:tripartite tricarboxylate transporter permease n=1 Tax=Caloramator sp. E03 TaxID=2576307 RepID=UPI001FA9EA7F|nr:tripartite tricarboxylate transporter permease [Caloramator sp. E03]